MKARANRGSVAIAALVVLLAGWSALAGGFVILSRQGESANRLRMSAAALALAEGGAAKGVLQAARDGSYKGEDDTPLGDGSFSVKVQREGGQFIVTATGWVGRKASSRYTETVRVVAGAGGDVLTWQKL